MRKPLLTLLAVALVGAVVPAAALAHHSRHHRARVHRARVRHERFGTTDSSTTGTTTPSDTAGTVASFTGGVLVIKLNGGSTVSGRVTDATEFECSMPASSATQSDLSRAGGGDQSGSDTSPPGEDTGDQNDTGDGEDNGAQAQQCSSSALTSGSTTTVREAELTVSSAGAVWHKVELVG